MAIEQEDAALECVYHGNKWRSSVQAVLNQLRGRYLQNKYLNRIARLVCPCDTQRFKDTDHQLFQEAGLKKLNNWFEEEIFCELDHPLNAVESIIKRMLKTMTKEHASRIRFLVIVKCAISQKLDILKRNDVNRSADNRQKYNCVEEFDLPLPSQYLAYYFGKGGCHIKAICLKYNCEIRLNTKIDRNSPISVLPDENTVKTTIKINCSKDVEAVKAALIERAQLITKKREQHAKKLVRYREIGNKLLQIRDERRANRRAEGYETSMSNLSSPETLKENKEKNFSVKQKHHSKDRSKKALTVLQELNSRCLNCLTPMSKETEGDECLFHPGFLVPLEGASGNKWSCCSEGLTGNHNREDQRASHADSGCESRKCHNWRPTENKAMKKRKQKMKVQDD